MAFQKIKSHLTIPEILGGVAPFGDVVLNHAADGFAEAASAKAQLPPKILQDYKIADIRSWMVQRRLIAANELAMTQSRGLRPPQGQAPQTQNQP